MEFTDFPEDYRAKFNQSNQNWHSDLDVNLLFLKSVEQFMNHLLQAHGHVFLNEVYDALHFPRSLEGQVVGWLLEGNGDGYISFGVEPDSGNEGSINLTFNVDGVVLDGLPRQ